jgi:pimeloyl-ACP methyl ester carboxylesterase
MSGPPLVLLPGLLCDETVWAHVRDALGARASVLIGRYDALDSLGAMAERVLESAPERFALAGHSMGGRVALEMLRRAPDRIAAIALMDTAVHPVPPGEAGEHERAGRHELLAIARERGMAAMAQAWVQGMLWPPRLQDAGLVQSVVDMFARKSPDIFAAQIRALLGRPDATPLLRSIRCPALVLCGEDDSWSPVARHREMAEQIPGARLVIVPECGHMCTLERPEAVTRALLDWHALAR